MRQFLASTHNTHRAYKCDLEITGNFATYPLQKARPGCRGREEETGPPTPLPKQRQNSREEKEGSERRWGVLVLQEADLLSKWHDGEQAEQEPVDRKLFSIFFLTFALLVFFFLINICTDPIFFEDNNLNRR